MARKINIIKREDGRFDEVSFEFLGKNNKTQTSVLNVHLLNKQRVSDEQLQKMIAAYRRMVSLVKRAASLDINKQKPRIKRLASLHREAEFELQESWNFPRDSRFHKYWYRFPHCTCPKLDNIDAYGTGRAVTNSNCPIHGQG